MKLLNIVLFAAACFVIAFLAAQSDSSAGTATVSKEPNPMKVNAKQFARMDSKKNQFASR